jgi:hypothetical protein
VFGAVGERVEPARGVAQRVGVEVVAIVGAAPEPADVAVFELDRAG